MTAGLTLCPGKVGLSWDPPGMLHLLREPVNICETLTMLQALSRALYLHYFFLCHYRPLLSYLTSLYHKRKQKQKQNTHVVRVLL